MVYACDMQKIIYDSQEKIRLDSFLASNITKLSRSSIKKLIENDSVSVNSKTVKSKYLLKQNDVIRINFDLTKLDEVPELSLPVIFEDSNVVVINKPSGILTHSKGVFNPEATVSTFISDKTTLENNFRTGIVHRLDRGTSGVIICAKNEKSLIWLQDQFKHRKVQKEYIAVVEGTLKDRSGIIDAPIGRNPKKPQTFRVHASGKSAISYFEVINSNCSFSKILLKPETGRTHQLRVHLSFLGHPIVGDTLYGGKKFSRLMLHAKSLSISISPKTKTKKFIAAEPEIFNNILK